LIDTGMPLGILPMGTANDLARTLQIPLDLMEASDVIGKGAVHHVDVGCVNGHYFFNVANIGLGVMAKRFLTPDLKRRWGIFSYARCLIKAIREFQPFHADIDCDGRKRRVRSLQIAVGNGRHYGGGMTVAEDASLEDARFHLYSIRPLKWWSLAKIGPALRSGEFGPDDPVDIASGFRITLRTRKPMPITADGESIAMTPAQFTMIPKAVKIIVPAHYLERKQELDHAA
jgi:diacylglycerol kinase (ATP)